VRACVYWGLPHDFAASLTVPRRTWLPDRGLGPVQPGILQLPHLFDGAVLRDLEGAVDQLPDRTGLDAHPLRDLSGAHPGQLQAQGFDPPSLLFPAAG
jgi:hypothetical protein